MNIKRNWIIGAAATATLLATGGTAIHFSTQRAGGTDGVATSVETLPPSATGRRPNLAGTVVTGRVAAVYVEVAKDVFMSIDQANDKLKMNAPRQVQVEFPDRLVTKDDAATAAYKSVADGGPDVKVGDLVTIKFPYRDMSGLLPETTRITQIAARRDEPLAREYEQRIAARKSLESMVTIAKSSRGSSNPEPLAGAAFGSTSLVDGAAGQTSVASQR